MKKFVVTLIALIAFNANFALAAADPNSQDLQDLDKVVVTINGSSITEAQLQAEIKPQLEKLSKQLPPAFLEQFKGQIRKPALQNLISKTLLDLEIKKNNIVITDDDINQKVKDIAATQNLTVDDLKELLQAYGMTIQQWIEKQDMRTGIAREKLLMPIWEQKTEPNEADAKKFYQDNKKRFSNPEMVKASHILISTDPKNKRYQGLTDPNEIKKNAKQLAQDILNKINAGEDFATLAKQHSDDPGSAAKGGELNFFPKGKMVPAFEAAAFALEPGKVSDLVETNYGYHIIKTMEKKQAGTKSYDEVKDNILSRLVQQQRETLARQYIESLKQKANIVYANSADDPDVKTAPIPNAKDPIVSPKPK